jgi:hypothetical protein
MRWVEFSDGAGGAAVDCVGRGCQRLIPPRAFGRYRVQLTRG